MKNRNTIIALAITSVATLAHADITNPADPGIFSPFDNAQAKVTFLGSDAGYTGVLSWADPNIGSTSVSLWNNHTASEGDSFDLPMLFQQGQRLDFNYSVITGELDFFSTLTAADWSQFRVDASDPTNILVSIEDKRTSSDTDFNDVQFKVSFIQTIPAPGSLALISTGGLLVSRRRRA